MDGQAGRRRGYSASRTGRFESGCQSVATEAAAALDRREEKVRELEERLSEAGVLRAEAARAFGDANVQRDRAGKAARMAEAAAERIVAEARRKARDILDRSRRAAQQECTEMRLQALEEIKAIMDRSG